MLTVPRQAQKVLASRISVFTSGTVNRWSVCSTGKIVWSRNEIYATSIVAKNIDSDARIRNSARLPVLIRFMERGCVKIFIPPPSNPPAQDVSHPKGGDGYAHWGSLQSCRRAGEMTFSIPM